ncbi:selenocysteine-specific elongation factor [Stackebrandtia albiflava]|uniref:Selenocysteine-specific elongation factor n=1 Tax=Stackebrandtia albiflava TaxID=406432 RepID=A0A562UR69_9ACTN|nr:selenocysteine-specific translation elongation factor [Stackebrandtia albiflava]TWJ08112.1 selenocysteine-specific elongation factor [Stackebrandtia albiflava]
MATAGHVDHGKSTLVKALTGSDPDTLAEERRRGLTIDLGFAWTVLPGGAELAFVDVPGHERYIGNTVTGIATAPAVLFTVAADDGWMPQSQEHLTAVDAFGIRHGLLVVTRADLADPAPATAEATARIARTGLGRVAAVAVSARTGAGMPELRRALAAFTAGLPSADPAAPVRLWIDRAFSAPGSGTVVTGTLAAGSIHIGQSLEVSPSGERVRVRGLHRLGRAVDGVTGPARVAVNLARVAVAAVPRGRALVAPGRWWRTTTVDVTWPATGRPPTEVLVHCGTAAVPARVRPLGPDAARLTLRRPLDLHHGDRILLRDTGRRVFVPVTVADPDPPVLTGRGAAAARGRLLATGSGAAVLLRGHDAMRGADLVAMGVTPESSGHDGWLLDPDHRRRLATRLAEVVAAHDAARPLDPGVPVADAARSLGLPEGLPVAAILEPPLVVAEGRVTRAGAEALPAEVAAGLAALTDELRAHPFRAPTVRRLTELGLTRAALARAVNLGVLWSSGAVYLSPDAPERAAAVARRLPEPFTVGDLSRALGGGRRVAIALLEHLDAAGVTRRAADGTRTLTPRARDTADHADLR